MQRRSFIIGSVAVAGGVLIGGVRLLRPLDNPLDDILSDGEVALTPYVIIDGGGVSVITPRAEMGQGIHSTLAALVAEELDMELGDLRVIPGPPSSVYANEVLYPPTTSRREILRERLNALRGSPDRTPQLTGGQTSIRDGYVKMRKAGAAARSMLVEAAARERGVSAALLRTQGGAVIFPDGSSIPYTRLAAGAAKIAPPEDPPLKPRDQWTVLGKSQPRVDMVGKCTGTAHYAIDTRLPGMLYGIVRRNPRLGGSLRGFDATAARQMTGVHDVIALENGIIVVASNTWFAMQAAREVEVEWGPAPYPDSSAEHRAALVDAIRDGSGRRWRDDGDVDRALADVAVIEGSYHVPYLAHATMEPLNAVAWLRDDQLDIWAGNQNPTSTQYVGAQLTGLPLEAVRVHTTYMGGGFGRRLEMDFVASAVRAARAIPGLPILVTWPREEDVTHDAYRPLASAAFRASISDGRPTALDLTVCSPGLQESGRHRSELDFDRADRRQVWTFSGAMGAFDQPYRIPNYRVTTANAPRLLPVGFWRSVGESQNVFFTESILDELAHVDGVDPLAMRLSLLDHAPSRAVLEAVAEMSDWGGDLPAGSARGLAYARSSDAATAQVLQVTLVDGKIRIDRSCAVVDVGVALDPRNIEAQVMSSAIWGLCAATHGEITISDGSVDQSNFHDYLVMRMRQAPKVDVRIHESGGAIYGVGESATATAAPALGNAIFALTGRRIRELPFRNSIPFV